MDIHNFKRIPFASQDEWDMLTGWRHYLFSDYGRSKRAKRGYNRRFRRKVRQSLHNVRRARAA